MLEKPSCMRRFNAAFETEEFLWNQWAMLALWANSRHCSWRMREDGSSAKLINMMNSIEEDIEDENTIHGARSCEVLAAKFQCSFSEAELQGKKNLAKWREKRATLNGRKVILFLKYLDHEQRSSAWGHFPRHSQPMQFYHSLSDPVHRYLAVLSFFVHFFLFICFVCLVWFSFSLGISRNLNKVQDINSVLLILLGLVLMTDFLRNIIIISLIQPSQLAQFSKYSVLFSFSLLWSV